VTAPLRSPARSPAERLAPGRPLLLSGIADGAEGLVLGDLARAIAAGKAAPAISLAVICRDGARMAMLSRALTFFAPDIEVLEFPAWDCLPYDRASPHAGVVAQRMQALSRLARVKGRDRPAVLLTTVNAILQRVPPRATLARQSLCGRRRQSACRWRGSCSGSSSTALIARRPCARPATTQCAAASSICSRPAWTRRCGSISSATRWNRSAAFDPETQRTTEDLRHLDLVPMAEFQLTTETIRAVSHRLCRGLRRRRSRRHAL
jgi:transcription-repair coupling factor (superfamily II helicase)